MKKLFLIMLILTLPLMLAAESAPDLEMYFDAKLTAGLRLKIPLTDLRLTLRPDAQNFAAAAYTSTILPRLPLTFKAGNLSAGGALSTLNSPELSAGSSPFTTSICAPSSLTAALPGYSTFSRPVSAFFEFSLPSTLPFAVKLNTLLQLNSPLPVTSFLLTLPLKKSGLTFSASCTAGRFSYENNASSSWFLKNSFYKNSEHNCALLQLSAQSKKSLMINLTAALYESPFGFYQLLYRADAKLSTKHTQITSQIFYNSYDDLLTSSEKKLSSSLQFKEGLLFKSPSKLASLYFQTPVFLRAASNIYLKINLSQTEHPLKANGGLQFSTEKTSQSLSISADASLISKSPVSAPHDFTIKTITAQLKSTWKTDNFTPSLTLNITLPQNQNSSKKYKISAATGYKSKNSNLTLNGSTTLTYTPDTQNQLKLAATLSLQIKIKYLKIIGKIAFNEDIEI